MSGNTKITIAPVSSTTSVTPIVTNITSDGKGGIMGLLRSAAGNFWVSLTEYGQAFKNVAGEFTGEGEKKRLQKSYEQGYAVALGPRFGGRHTKHHKSKRVHKKQRKTRRR